MQAAASAQAQKERSLAQLLRWQRGLARTPVRRPAQYCGSCLSCSPFPGGPPEAWEPLDWFAAFCCRSCISTAYTLITWPA